MAPAARRAFSARRGNTCAATTSPRRNGTRSSAGPSYGQEKKSLAYVLGVMNMILHGIEAPSIRHAKHAHRERDGHPAAGPPRHRPRQSAFRRGRAQRRCSRNFPIKSGETAYLFLQHFIRKLKAGGGGRGAVVIKEHLPQQHRRRQRRAAQGAAGNLATSTPCSTAPAARSRARGSRPWCCSSSKGAKTRSVWYYQLDPGAVPWARPTR